MKPAALAVLALLVIAALGLAAALLGGYLPQPWSQSPVASFRSPTGAVPATPQRPGNAEAGYRALVNAPYVSCGMPHEADRSVILYSQAWVAAYAIT